MRDVATVAVIGTGVIGTSWAVHFLAYGRDVVAADVAPDAEARLRESVDRLWPAATALHQAPTASPDRLRFTTDLDDAARSADFVQENATERVEAKQALIAQLDGAAHPDVVIASSSSGLVPSVLQQRCDVRPERVIVGHPFDPPHLIPLVEVVAGTCWAEEHVTAAMDFYRAVGKRPVRLRREVPGHIANRLQAALWREAYSLVSEGVASVADVDAAVAGGPGLRWAQYGPFVNLALSAGPAGMAGMHRHLGPTMAAIWQDLSTPELDDALVDTVNHQTDQLIAELGGDRVRTDREALVIALLQRQRRQWAQGEEHQDA